MLAYHKCFCFVKTPAGNNNNLGSEALFQGPYKFNAEVWEGSFFPLGYSMKTVRKCSKMQAFDHFHT